MPVLWGYSPRRSGTSLPECDASDGGAGSLERRALLFGMNAEPLLRLVARVVAKRKLDVVMIGNAAAALQGSPVTTLDVDFMFRDTPLNLRKLRRIADDLDALA